MLLREKLFKSFGRKRIIAAAAAGNLQDVELLLDTRADLVDVKDNLGRTALEWAALHGHKAVADLLLAKGAHCSIFTAARLGDVNRVKALLRENPDIIHARGDRGTALHAAASKGRVDVIKFLVDCDANLSAVGALHLTPLQCAVAFCQKEAVQALVEKGADVNAKDKQGRTALQLAKAEIRATDQLKESGFMKTDARFESTQRELVERWKEIAVFLLQQGAME
jgi:ankyrin repeat protein